MQRPCALAIAVISLGLLAACSPSRKQLKADLAQVRGELEQSQGQRTELEQKIDELGKDIEERQRKITALEAANAGLDTELGSLRDEQKRRRDELATYQELFARLRKLIDSGQIKVSFRAGRMIVALPSAVLFDSGRTELRANGQSALTELSAALKSVAHRNLVVAGHTDNVPIKTRRYRNNWQLSTERAVVVVEYMIAQGFPKDHLAAAGYAEQDPIADNANEDGRANNRRIEIQLIPDLGQLAGIEGMVSK